MAPLKGRLALALGLHGALPPPASAAPVPTLTPPSEYQLKAAFLYNFAKFVEWPAESWEAGKPFVVAVLGEDPFGPVLDVTMAGKSVQDHPVEVRRVSRPEDARGAHILFVSASERRRLDRVLQHAGRGVLTVGDTDGFAARGVIINFRLAENRVRFEINSRRAEEAGLRLSSQILKLATLVEEQP